MTHFNGQSSIEPQQESFHYYALLVPKHELKLVKTTLEQHEKLHQRLKISSQSSSHSRVPTNVSVVDSNQLNRCSEQNQLSIDDVDPDLAKLVGSRYDVICVAGQQHLLNADPLFHQHVSTSLACVPAEILLKTSLSHRVLLQNLRSSYCVYRPMLLLSVQTFGREPWIKLLRALMERPAERDSFFAALAGSMKATHIATDAPIPFLTPHSTSSNDLSSVNLIRSPTNIQPVYGDFGHRLPGPPAYHPTKTDFQDAFWVSTKQNNITQTWAPYYLMFSAGNVTEKSRILHLASVRDAVRCGLENDQGSTAVDLFAGIGYFAFSYAKAGVQKVLCWDINPWSVEALSRGAKLNKWKAQVMSPSDPDEGIDFWPRDCRFLVFNESNVNAKRRILHMRSRLPPIRHVNCGMLPSANAAWETAVEALDTRLGGWIHLHETTRDTEITARANEILAKITHYSHDLRRTASSSSNECLQLDHIEKVKSIGPRLMHIVLDIWVPPL